MINVNLSLDVGSNIKINGVRFVVDGFIVFMDCEDTRWTEYKLKSNEEFKVRWLSVDVLNNEYAIYSEELYSEEFSEDNIKFNGYKKVGSTSAKVVDYSGNVDVNLEDQVFYKEYEDNTEEWLIAIENWNNEYEFSKGYYIDKNDIEKLDFKFNNMDNTYILDKVNKPKEQKINLGIIMKIILMTTILISISLIFCLSNNKQDNSLSKFVSSDSNFQYETSITSDLNEEKKADVYSTNKTIEEATKLIIDAVQGNIEDVQENKEDNTVAITTTDEMALIYLSEDFKVLVQVSSREYIYASRNTIYRGGHGTNSFYRNYYYSRWYSEDKKRYKKLANGYRDYNNSTITLDDNNKYKTYSDSIRQSSVKSRSSSGDGISSGK